MHRDIFPSNDNRALGLAAHETKIMYTYCHLDCYSCVDFNHFWILFTDLINITHQ
jgi:hypothetical protein